MTVECRLCEVEMTDIKALQNEDKHCIRIKNLMEDPNSKFPERNRYCYENELLCYKTLDMGKEYKAVAVPKSLIPTVLKEMMIDLDILALEKHILSSRDTTFGLR